MSPNGHSTHSWALCGSDGRSRLEAVTVGALLPGCGLIEDDREVWMLSQEGHWEGGIGFCPHEFLHRQCFLRTEGQQEYVLARHDRGDSNSEGFGRYCAALEEGGVVHSGGFGEGRHVGEGIRVAAWLVEGHVTITSHS